MVRSPAEPNRAAAVVAAIAAFGQCSPPEARSAERLSQLVSLAVLDSSEVTIVLIRGDGVGPYNTDASRQKAQTAPSTRTPSFEMMKNAAADPTAQNLKSLPELLLAGGAVKERATPRSCDERGEKSLRTEELGATLVLSAYYSLPSSSLVAAKHQRISDIIAQLGWRKPKSFVCKHLYRSAREEVTVILKVRSAEFDMKRHY